MNENLNLVEILKDCPKGIELYSPIYGLGILTKVTNRIHVKFPKEHNVKCFRPDGKVSEDGKIMLFPKGKTTWEGFQRPFVDGDIVMCGNDQFAIFKEHIEHLENEGELIRYYVYYDAGEDYLDVNGLCCIQRLAAEEEKAELFQAIKENGYKWNAETKTLEKLIKPKFKVGDKIIHKSTGTYCTFGEYAEGISAYYTNIGLSLTPKDLEQWELAPNKFDPKTLQPFDKVLVRQFNDIPWCADFYSHSNEVNGYHICVGGSWDYCIPYNENTKHLVGKTEDAPEFYRYWEIKK